MSEKFKMTMEEYAKQLEWKISEAYEEFAVFDFKMESGNDLSVYVGIDEGTIVFSVPSIAVVEHEEDISHQASTFLLKRNTEIEIGFWALEELEDGWGYVLYYEELAGEDFPAHFSLDAFRDIVEILLEECEDFNETWEEEEDW